MRIQVGVWIDRRRARIVEMSGQGEWMRTIESGVGKRVRLAGGSRSRTIWGPQEIASELSRDRKFREQLNRYYDRVVESLVDADAIFLCGPGEAKKELRDRMARSNSLAARVVGFVTQDKMSDRQLKARVRSFFRQRPASKRA